MLKITRKSNNRVDIDLEGVIDADAMRNGLDDLFAASDGVTQGQMLYRITNFSLPTMAAIGVEMARLPQLFGLLGKYDRCAVLSDSGWLRKAASAEGALFPGLDIRSFELGEEDMAEEWLTEKAV